MDKSALEKFTRVLDKKRDPYIEWHDGPCLGEVDSALENLGEEDNAEAADLVAERLEAGYSQYLGRAAELLGGERSMDALSRIMKRTDSAAAADAAGNLLASGRPEEAMKTLMRIVSGTSLGWSDRINALVNFKTALGKIVSVKERISLLTPKFRGVILSAVKDDEYLVRYHAAEAILRVCGDSANIADKKDLFSLICGNSAPSDKPGEADRIGFDKAVQIFEEMLGRTPA